jgi:three-Cys-motif partner protein
VLSNRDQGKWGYPEHTKKKHAILIRYMQAWLRILGGGARAAGYLANLAIVDTFAGRGRYTTGDRGSPLLLRDLAGRVVTDQRVDRVELHYIESDAENWAELRDALALEGPLPGVIERGPVLATFESAAPPIINSIRQSRQSSFWSIDPFGYTGLPLSLIRRILTLARAEVFVTLMVRDMNRFLNDPPHLQAISQTLDLAGNELTTALDAVKLSENRMQALRDLYVEQLEVGATAGRRLYVTSVRVAEDGPDDTVYYLVHATSHPKGKREMKEAISEATGGLNAVFGTKDPSVVAERVGQLGMFSDSESREMRVDYRTLKDMLRADFAGRRTRYEDLLNETVAGHTYDDVTDQQIKTALEQLSTQGVKRFRGGQLSAWALSTNDILEFPAQ